ncbi:hypothetical protein BGZ67_001932 [Mortierella alpina]|nr:hypothetical protein BGZ67_001932 [Mortierella alpina]
MHNSFSLLVLAVLATTACAYQCAKRCSDCPIPVRSCQINAPYCKMQGYNADETILCLPKKGSLETDFKPSEPETRPHALLRRSHPPYHNRHHESQCLKSCDECPPGNYCQDEPSLCDQLGAPSDHSQICLTRPPGIDDPICVVSCEDCPLRTRCEYNPSFCNYLGHLSGESVYCSRYSRHSPLTPVRAQFGWGRQ